MDFELTYDAYLNDRDDIQSFLNDINAEDPQLDDIDLDNLEIYIDDVKKYLDDFRSLLEAAEADNNDERKSLCAGAIIILIDLQSRLRYIKEKDEEAKSLVNGV